MQFHVDAHVPGILSIGMQFFMWFLFIISSITSSDDQGLFVCLKSSETKEFVKFSVLTYIGE